MLARFGPIARVLVALGLRFGLLSYDLLVFEKTSG
jgi:hypothetical protein